MPIIRLLIAGLFLFFFSLTANASAAMPDDSIRVENVTANSYVVIHQVDPKETWFSLSRRYKVPVGTLRKANPEAGDGLALGQMVRVPVPRKLIPKGKTEAPFTKPAPSPLPAEKVPADRTEVSVGGMSPPTHTVATGEGLYSIARKYGVSINDIKRWNELADNSVQVGQTLIVAEPKPAVEKVKVRDNETKPINPTAATADEPEPAIFTNSGFDMVREAGLADIIADDRNSKKHLALHKSAPAGTLVKVKNELNGATVYVRVIGKLPDTGPNENIILRISKKAHEKLQASNRSFPVEVTYPAP